MTSFEGHAYVSVSSVKAVNVELCRGRVYDLAAQILVSEMKINIVTKDANGVESMIQFELCDGWITLSGATATYQVVDKQQAIDTVKHSLE